jgi:RsiW-degrading membrane proteinase PrsW (M82 family)
MENQTLIAILYSLPLLGIVAYISSKPEYSIKASVTWVMFIVTYFLSEMAGIVNAVIIEYTQTYLVSLVFAAINEEVFKLVMIITFLQYFKKRVTLLQSLCLGGTCCLAFAVSENWYYIVRDDLNVLPGIQALARIAMPSPMHFMTGSIIAIYSFQYYVRERSINNVFIGLGFGSVIHIVYNIGAGSSLILMSFAVAVGTIIAFTSYKRFDTEPIIKSSFHAKTRHDAEVESHEYRSIKKIEKKDGGPKIVSKRKLEKIKIVQKKK